MAKKLDVSPSEALYGFVDWLNSRCDQVTLSQHNDPTDMHRLLTRFCELNNWEASRIGWMDKIQTPKLID